MERDPGLRERHMDAQCFQLLPDVCGILADSRQLMTDDSVYEKLLDWFKSLLMTVPPEMLLDENQCVAGLLQQVLRVGETDPSLLAFSMRLVGMLAAQEGGFKYLLYSHTNSTWKDASVRRAWIQGLLSMVQHREAVQLLHTAGVLELMLDLLMDSSLFVAHAANDLVAHVFITCVKLEGHLDGGSVSNLPDMAQTIFRRLEKLLTSGNSQLVNQSLRSLTAIFRDCTDSLAEILWPRTAELIVSLLDQKPIHAAPHLEGLLLAVTRFPDFCNADCDLWIVMKRALNILNPFHAGSLAFGILRLKQCPQDVGLQAACVILHPLDCVLRISSENTGQRGFLDEPVSDPVIVRNLLSTKSSCVSLLCQSLSHLMELCERDGFPMQIPHASVLCSVVSVLQFSIGQAACSSSTGSHFCRFLIGSLRVQRSALDAIGALSCWPLRADILAKTYNVLTAYLESPETDPTVLKKAFQASLKWLQASRTSDEHWEQSNSFLQALCPVLMKRCCSPTWEVRDSTLEFVTHVAEAVKDQGEFGELLSSSGIPKLVLDLLKDPESYVRASAVICIGHIIGIAPIYKTVGNSISAEPLKREDLVLNLMDILCQDTEGFPRRAVVRVFTDWLRKGDMQNFHDAENLLSRILEVTLSDLDWEVKVNALDLADVFICKTFALGTAYSLPYTIGLPDSKSSITDALLQCKQIGLFQFLLSCLCDCDRPVALKACDILLCVKTELCEGNSCTAELYGRDWLEQALKDQRITAEAGNGNVQHDTSWVLDVLKKIDFDNLKCSLSKSSDYLHETPLSLLQDIKATFWGGEEHDADCY
ncbi:BRCA1-associated ATM activator 1 isoform X2 [Pseudophryne corroboree]|uniref:BRCA1-associated ATM activator 1 isoform X2 n=1 Tax=Pseudophryne corroboree TaxID=495146 RepID=UPI0030818845